MTYEDKVGWTMYALASQSLFLIIFFCVCGLFVLYVAGRNCPAIFLVVYLFLSLYSVVTYFKSGFLLLITPLARYAHGCSYFWSSLFKFSSSADHFRTSICQVRIHRVGVRVLLQRLFIVSSSIAPPSAASQCINNLS